MYNFTKSIKKSLAVCSSLAVLGISHSATATVGCSADCFFTSCSSGAASAVCTCFGGFATCGGSDIGSAVANPNFSDPAIAGTLRDFANNVGVIEDQSAREYAKLLQEASRVFKRKDYPAWERLSPRLNQQYKKLSKRASAKVTEIAMKRGIIGETCGQKPLRSLNIRELGKYEIVKP